MRPFALSPFKYFTNLLESDQMQTPEQWQDANDPTYLKEME